MSVLEPTLRMEVGLPLPPALPQFGHIRRTWDADLGVPLDPMEPTLD